MGAKPPDRGLPGGGAGSSRTRTRTSRVPATSGMKTIAGTMQDGHGAVNGGRGTTSEGRGRSAAWGRCGSPGSREGDSRRNRQGVGARDGGSGWATKGRPGSGPSARHRRDHPSRGGAGAVAKSARPRAAAQQERRRKQAQWRRRAGAASAGNPKQLMAIARLSRGRARRSSLGRPSRQGLAKAIARTAPAPKGEMVETADS